MKKYQLSKKILKSILSLCDSKGIFNKEFKGNLQIKVTELYGDNIFLVKSNIINLFSSTNAEFNICYAENYFIEESEEKMFKALNKLHRHFNIYELADDFGVDVEIFGIAFSFLHEIGHIYKYIRIIKVYFSNILSKFILNISLSACVFDTITPLYVESSV